MEYCKLCLVKKANKKNSHIVPRFLGKPLFENTQPRRALQIDKEGKKSFLQDTQKENYILCSNCEKRISIVETYFARKWIAVNDFGNRRENFYRKNVYNNDILICKKIDPTLLKFFIYSVIWRISISQSEIFQKFKLPNFVEKEIHLFLNENLQDTHEGLISSLNLITKWPKYHFTLFKPIRTKRATTGVYTAYQISENLFNVFTSELVIQFYIKDDGSYVFLELISNAQNDEARIILSSSENWRNLSQAVLDKFKKKL